VSAVIGQETTCFQVETSGATLSASHDNTINGNEDYTHAFDSSEATKWLVYEAVDEPVWVQIILSEATIVTKYGITSADDAPERDPAAWEVSASNDGIYFVTLDVQIGITWDERYQRQVFSVENEVAYSYYRFDFNSVRDMNLANSMQLNYIALYEGECEDPCCGVDCGEHGSCNSSDGSCTCDTGYDGSACADVTVEWADYVGRSISGASWSSAEAASLEDCQTICVEGNEETPCIGVNFDSSSGTCDVVAGTLSGWTLTSASSSEDSTASLLLSANLLDSAEPDSKNVEEEATYVVSWDPVFQQMPRIDIYIGETVTFEWEDVNVRNLPNLSEPNHHNIYLFAGEAQYQRCDFRAAKVVAVAPLNDANEPVTWSSTTEGKYYFGSSYDTDCSVGQLKVIVEVSRRPTP